ncbi:nucleoside diphosphate kinase regulator [Mesorhizobium sp. INR15]|uniref:nucleoside diphosphate kinase regulator n=1 Tax=Mesorhizobium sp. INR15 TaxID=2654248 RepID=UPI0018965460|nr:nucleoside diphosphate kinase regulator [Mesorhizobium sp. INR15]QPC92976.1 nucleoside diphosphate kinase regulator [Mesorhizobium sp. INR15]
MAPDSKRHSKPSIVLTRSDHGSLLRLAESISGKNPAVADQLLSELDRARVVADSQLRLDVVRMGSTLRFTTDAGEDRTVTLVFPAEADIAEGKVSILTPIGAALIGLSSGQSIAWTARDGRSHRLTVQSIEQFLGKSAASPSNHLVRAS